MYTDEVIAKQLVLLFCGRMGTARRLTRPSFMRETAQAGLGASSQSRFALVGRFVRERISVAGYDRAGPVFVKVRKRSFVLSLSIGNFFEFCTKKFLFFF